MIKSILIGFHTIEVISVNKLPPSRRINTTNKLKLGIEDLHNLLVSINQSGELNKLPRYAFNNLDHNPVFKMDAGGLSFLSAQATTNPQAIINSGYNVRNYRPIGLVKTQYMMMPNPIWIFKKL